VRFPTLGGTASHVLVEASDWPAVELDLRLDLDPEIDSRGGHWNSEGTYMALTAGGLLEIKWPYSINLTLPTSPAPEFVVQPFLATAASCVAVHTGKQAFHAGAIVVDGGAWAIFGDKGAGKSTTLGRLHQMGVGILTDDVLICDGLDALAGPRCIDLRVEPAQYLNMGEDFGIVGLRERWRVYLDASPVRVPLRGWIHLDWADENAVRSVPVVERLPLLYQNQSLRLPVHDPAAFMAFASLPTYQWSRQRSWEQLDGAIDLLLRTLA
jgi:hypothetical protein